MEFSTFGIAFQLAHSAVLNKIFVMYDSVLWIFKDSRGTKQKKADFVILKIKFLLHLECLLTCFCSQVLQIFAANQISKENSKV